MKILLNKTKLDIEEINNFFDEAKVESYLFKKSKDDPIRFPWDTRAPRVYKYKDYFIKIHGLKRRYHFFTGMRVSEILKRAHKYLNDNHVKTVYPEFLGVKGRYSVVVTPDIEKLGMKLLSEFDPKIIKNSTINIHNSLEKLGLYHGDNKSDNSAIDVNTNEIVLLDIDSIEKPHPLFKPKWKLKKKTLESLKRKVSRLERLEYESCGA